MERNLEYTCFVCGAALIAKLFKAADNGLEMQGTAVLGFEEERLSEELQGVVCGDAVVVCVEGGLGKEVQDVCVLGVLWLQLCQLLERLLWGEHDHAAVLQLLEVQTRQDVQRTLSRLQGLAMLCSTQMLQCRLAQRQRFQL